MKNPLSFILLISLLAFGCKKSDSTTNPIPEPTGRQRDIPWPSLANSPWPMNHGNPQSSGRSKLTGPTLGEIEWEKGLAWGTESAVIVSNDSLFIFGFQFSAIDLAGSLRWSSVPNPTQDRLETTPIATANGNLISASMNGIVYAVDQHGSLLWKVQLGEPVYQQGSNIGMDGVFYCVSFAKTLFAVSPDGNISWQLKDNRFSGGSRSVLTFSPDGTTLYVPGSGVTVNAVNIQSRTVQWTFGTDKELDLAPIVDSDGNIYVLGTDSIQYPKPSLISLHPDGTVRWAFIHGNHFPQLGAGDPTIDAEGNIYFAFDTLYSVSPSGSLRWKKDLSAFGANASADVPLVCDNHGNIYVIVTAAGYTQSLLVVFDQNGAVQLNTLVDSRGYSLDSSPAILWDSRLALAGQKNDKLWLIR